MTTTAGAEHVTPTALLGEVREVRATAVVAECRLLVLAAEWADAHPVPRDAAEPYAASRARAQADPGASGDVAYADREFDPERGIPAWSWASTASFAAAVGRTTAGGDAMIRDALVLRHRLPRVWRRLVSGQAEAWRCRRIAQAVLGQPDDVCAHLDAVLDDISHRVGPATLDRLLDEALLRLHPEERELAQIEALDRRHATLHEASITDTGVAEMTLRADWKDLHDLDQALSQVAAALARVDQAADLPADSLDVRRARAVGVLADPAGAVALLADQPAPSRPSKRTTLFVHLSDLAVLGLEPVGRNETGNRAVLEQQVRSWCGRTDAHLTVQPVIDLTDHERVDGYEVRDRFESRQHLLHSTCAFPWCTRPSRLCDHDHRVPWAAGGHTCDCNIAPLCRRHHRLKTHAGWRYTLLEPGTWLWSEPHGQQFLRDATGTLDVTPRDRFTHRGPAPRPPARDHPPARTRVPDAGCRAGP